jgi:agmatine/peptidylarginine deiminase
VNNLPKWKQKIICWLAKDEPVIINFTLLPGTDKKAIIYIPPYDDRETAQFYSEVARLVPTRNIIERTAREGLLL